MDLPWFSDRNSFHYPTVPLIKAVQSIIMTLNNPTDSASSSSSESSPSTTLPDSGNNQVVSAINEEDRLGYIELAGSRWIWS